MPSLFNEFLRYLPERYGTRLRSEYLRREAGGFGARSSIGRGCRVLRPANLQAGDGVRIARDVTLDCRGGLVIEDDALIGFESILLTYTHNADEIGVPVQDQGFWSAPIHIGRRAWLGMRVMILPGVTIGEDAIIASGAVVTRDVAPRTVVAGVPAQLLRER